MWVGVMERGRRWRAWFGGGVAVEEDGVEVQDDEEGDEVGREDEEDMQADAGNANASNNFGNSESLLFTVHLTSH
jgi:hypothetical protein